MFIVKNSRDSRNNWLYTMALFITAKFDVYGFVFSSHKNIKMYCKILQFWLL